MPTVDLKNMLDDPQASPDLLADLKITQIESARSSLSAMVRHGVPLDLMEAIVEQLKIQLPGKPDPDLGLRNLERFVVSSRSPMSLAALLVRDPSALSALLDIFSYSEYLSDLLIRDPESFDLIRLTDGQPVAKEILFEELEAEIQSASGLRSAKNRLRRFKQREILRIAYGDLVRKFEIERTSQQLAYLAESICEVGIKFCLERQKERFGTVYNDSGQPAGIALLGAQRIGASNLDYANLISVIAIHDSGSESDGKKKLKCSDYFNRLLEDFEDLLAEANEFGACYQIRWQKRHSRGTGKSSSVKESIRFFDQNSTARDRLDLIQVKHLCGDKRVADLFLAARDQICFRSFFARNDLEEIQSLKHGLQPGSDAPEEFRNIKTSPGGIHDLEFTVNFLQLLTGRRIPEVRLGDFFEAIYQLESHGVLTQQEFARLKENYSYLRTVSHRLQLCQTEATDVLPKNKLLIQRLGRQLSQHFGTDLEFNYLEKVKKTASENLKILSHLLQWEAEGSIDPLKDRVLTENENQPTTLKLLSDLGFQYPEVADKCLSRLSTERHRFISSKRCRFFLASIVSELFRQISQTPSPDETLNSLTVVSDSLGGKGTLWELFRQNRSCLKLYINLCANTPYLASILQSSPGMLDELMDSLTNNRLESAEDYQVELDLACGTSRDVLPVIQSFKNSKHLQLGVAQLVGKRKVSQIHQGLSAVADCCIQKLAAVEYEALCERHGTPWRSKHDSPCEYGVVVGGKIGALEPNYHSTAVTWILFQSEGRTKAGRNQKSILNQQFFSQLATNLVKLLSRSDRHGRLYEVEPLPASFGDSSTIALSFEKLESKVQKRLDSAELMIFLSLCRVLTESQEFENASQNLMDEALISSTLTVESWRAEWGQRVAAESGASRYNLKRAKGGTRDIETTTHFLYVLHRDLLNKSTNTSLMLRELSKAKLVDEDHAIQLVEGYQKLKEIELYLRLMNLPRRHALPIIESETSSQDGEVSTAHWNQMGDSLRGGNAGLEKDLIAQQLRLATLLGYGDFDELRKNVESIQEVNRRIVTEVMNGRFSASQAN